MVLFIRDFKQIQIVIKIEENLYHRYSQIFCSLFSTYERKCLGTCPNPKTIHIFSPETSCNWEVCDYYCVCHTDEPHWITSLIDFLAYCYYSILTCTVLHGSCVQINGNNVLMLGGRRSGKSTLTYHLIRENNALYLDDDDIFLYNHTLVGFNSPIRMRNLYDNDAILLGQVKDADNELRYVCQVEIQQRISQVIKLHCIVFPQYNQNIDFQISELCGYNLINKVISNTKESSNLFSTFNDIANYFCDIPAYSVQYDKCSKVADFLTKI